MRYTLSWTSSVDTYIYLSMPTPFFPQFRARFAACRRRLQQVRRTRLSQLEPLFGHLLPPGLLAPADQGPNSRERLFWKRVPEQLSVRVLLTIPS